MPIGNRRYSRLGNLRYGALLGSLLFAGAVSGWAAETNAPKTNAVLQPPQILGIFGGMGPEATANLYQEVVKLTPAQRDQDHIPTLIYSLPQVPDRTTAIKNQDRSIVPYLVEGVTRLEKGGASFIVIPCNTAHYFYDDMQRAVKIPIVHMIRETVQAVVMRHPDCRRVGLLATSGTIASGLYEKEFRARGLEVICPDAGIQSNCVMKAVYGIKAGADKQASEDLLFKAGKSLETKGAQVIVLGCTEIPLAFNSRRASVPVVNATRVLAEAAIRCFKRGPSVIPGSERTVTVVFVARILNCTTEPVKRPRLTIHAPVEAPQQTISALDVEGSPARTVDGWNSPILVYERAKLAPGESLIGRYTATATIRELQWDLPEGTSADGASLPAEEAAPYLRDLKYLALHDSGIRAALEEATHERRGPRARLEGIYDLVMKRLTYERDDQWDPAPQVLATGKGSCSEYSYCFMALCRAGGIPARYVGGLTGRENVPFFLDTVFHRYPQAYVAEAGWVDFDPTRNERAKDPRRFFGRTSRLMLLTCVGDGGEGSLTDWDYLESHEWDGAKTNAARIRAGWWFADPPPAEVKQRTEAFRKHLAGASAASRAGLVDEALAVGHPFVLPWLDDLLYEPATRVAAARAFLKIGGEAVLRSVVDSLGRLPDAEGDRQIGDLLNAFTGQDFATDRKKWQEWLKTRMPQSPL